MEKHFCILSLLFYATFIIENTISHYNLYDRNKYHYDFPLKKEGHTINSPPEEPWRIYFLESTEECSD